MFDTITWRNRSDWQTKDLDCALNHFRITPAGLLQKEQIEYVELPEAEWPTNPGDKWHGILGTIKKVHGGWDTLRYTGDIDIYRSNNDLTNWEEHRISFDDGVITKIVQIAPAPDDEGNPPLAAGNAGNVGASE